MFQCCRKGPLFFESNLMSGLVANADELNYRGIYVQEDSIVLSRAKSLPTYIPSLYILEGSVGRILEGSVETSRRFCQVLSRVLPSPLEGSAKSTY